jgi:hypothetical protein
MLLSLRHNIHFTAEHYPGILNKAADMLSRLQVADFLVRFPHMQPTPTIIPPELMTL